MENDENEKGVWRTIRGRRIFIRSGESLGSAMARSGKFKNKTKQSNNSTRIKYIDKDIKPIYVFNRKQETRGYELNGIYLLKTDRYGDINSNKQWVINETSDQAPTYIYNGVEAVPYHQEDKVTYFKTFKEGKEKLVELANKKINNHK